MAIKKKAPVVKKPMTKTQLIQALTDTAGEELSKKQIKTLLDTLTDIGHKQLKRHGSFTLPGFAKFTVKKKKAVKAGLRKNPFTGEEKFYPAKPASKRVTARAVKACKDAVN